MNNRAGGTPEDRGNLKGFYSYKNTFEKDSVWLDIPKHGTTAHRGEEWRDVVLIACSHLCRQLGPVRRRAGDFARRIKRRGPGPVAKSKMG